MKVYNECIFAELKIGDLFYLTFPLGFKFKVAADGEKPKTNEPNHKDFVVLVLPQSSTFTANQKVLKEV
jgi:hypothetical protein